MRDKPAERAVRLVAPAGPPEKRRESQSVRLNLAAGSAGYQRTRVDLVFVIDTTGSMDGKIAGLIASCRTFADRFAARGLDWRIAVVAFGDLTVRGDRIVATGYTDKIDLVHSVLSRVPRYDGGGNLGESSLQALQQMIELGSRPGAMRIAIVITDEPPLDQDGTKLEQMIAALREAKVITFTVAPDLTSYRRIAQATGGRWFSISAETDFSSILAMFEKVVTTITDTVRLVELEAGGDVGRYLALAPGMKDR